MTTVQRTAFIISPIGESDSPIRIRSDKVKRHKIFIKAQELKGIRIIYGEFRKRDKHCRVCKNWYQTFEEKQTDVNIAIKLFELAIQDKYDKALIISGDSDLIPSIKAVKSTFPHKGVDNEDIDDKP